MRLSFDDEESFKEVVGSLHFNNSLPHDSERSLNEDIRFNSDPNPLERVGSSTPPQERSEDNEIIAA
jgi:hypothetical protein